MEDQDGLKLLFRNADIIYEAGDIEQIVLERIMAHKKQVQRLLFYRRLGKVGLGITILLFACYTLLASKMQNESGFSSLYLLSASAMILIVIAIELEFMPTMKNNKS